MIGTLLFFLGVDYIVQRRKRRQEATSPKRQAVQDRFFVPRGYFFSPSHAWIELLTSGKVRIGIDDFSQKIIGAIESVQIRPGLSTIQRGEPLLWIQQGKRTLAVTAPLSGRLVEINPELQKQPSLINDDPYVNGWIATVEPENLAADLKQFAVADETAKWLKREISRFRDFIKVHTPQPAFAEAGVTMADGGIPITGVLKSADAETWKSFEKEFLTAL